jgi:hypothetical protein
VQIYLSVRVCHFAILTCRSYGADRNFGSGAIDMSRLRRRRSRRVRAEVRLNRSRVEALRRIIPKSRLQRGPESFWGEARLSIQLRYSTVAPRDPSTLLRCAQDDSARRFNAPTRQRITSAC